MIKAMSLIQRRFPTQVLILLPLLVTGCKGKESTIPGNWSSKSGITYKIKADKTWSMTVPVAKKPTGMVFAGTWTYDGTDVTLQPVTVAGKSVAEAKQRLQAFATKVGSSRPMAQTFADDIDKPDILSLSDDGKTLTSDKAKDKNKESITLTKKE